MPRVIVSCFWSIPGFIILLLSFTGSMITLDCCCVFELGWHLIYAVFVEGILSYFEFFFWDGMFYLQGGHVENVMGPKVNF